MTEKNYPLTLTLFSDEVTVHRLHKETPLSFFQDIFALKWFTISKTLDELSIVVPTSCALTLGRVEDDPNYKREGGWRVLKIEGVLDFGLVGILASIINPLKDAGIPVFVISTYDTDYILVKNEQISNAKKVIVETTRYVVNLSEENLV